MSSRLPILSRRTVLKGMGVAIALPLLEAMVPSALFAGDPRVTPQKKAIRFGVVYMPNGISPKHWDPPTPGSLTTLSPILAPLAALRGEILVLSQLWHKGTVHKEGHFTKEGSFLTGGTVDPARTNCGGISVDQLAAKLIGHATRLPSIELGTMDTEKGIDKASGIPHIYGGHIAWSSPSTPAPKEIDPRQAFDRLFSAGVRLPTPTTATVPASGGGVEDASILDAALQDATALRLRLGVVDQRKLDEYLSSVRDIERRMKRDSRPATAPAPLDQNAGKVRATLAGDVAKFNPLDVQPANYAERVRLMLDIMVLAFWTDSTRIATFMVGNGSNSRNFSFVDGVTGRHHDLSHHENNKDKTEQYKRCNIWFVQQFAYLLGKMQAIREGDATLLDNSMLLFGSGIRDGNTHDVHDLPVVLAGRGGRTIQPGRHIVFKKDTALCNLHGEILSRLGIVVDRFGDSDGSLPELAKA